MAGYVYVLKSPRCKRYYIGSTANPSRRLTDHNRGRVTATKNKGPWKIVLLHEYENLKTAKRIEYKIKKFKNRQLLEKMIKDKLIKLK